MAKPARWEHFPHGADLGIRGFGSSVAAAFEQVALAMSAAITEPALVQLREPIEVECEAASLEDLLFDWLATIVFEMSTKGMIFGRFEVAIADLRLRARLWGEPIDRVRHEPAIEIKGPTYTQLRVAREPGTGEWVAQAVVDV